MTHGETYNHPKVLVIDNPECAESLIAIGYNVTEGTFGSVEETSEAEALPLKKVTPPLYRSEQEVIVVDMTNVPDTGVIEDNPVDGVNYIYQRPVSGVIDVRPLAAAAARKDFDRILKHGGLFVVVMGEEYSLEYMTSTSSSRGVRLGEAESVLNTCFLSALECLKFKGDSGNEIIINPELHASDIQFWRRMLKRAKYNVSFQLNAEFFDKCWELAANKYGDIVAALMRNSDTGAVLLLLPELEDLPSVLPEIFSSVLASSQPRLFRELENNTWINDRKFSPPGILALEERKAKVLDDARQAVEKIEREIQVLHDGDKHLCTLLTGTGDELVKSVIAILFRLGFTSVVDCDAEHTGDNLREDIQVRDRQPVLVIDVKGIAGGPDDAECAQAEKHTHMRFNDSEGKFKALMIINHERNLHPDRRKAVPFRAEIVKASTLVSGGLMTTCELFWLVRNAESLGWTPEQVKPIFYRSGVVCGMPDHYELLGEVCHVWAHAIGVVTECSVTVGDRIAVRVDSSFAEFEVVDLKVNEVKVLRAEKGDQCGVAVKAKEFGIREGMKLFVIRSTTHP